MNSNWQRISEMIFTLLLTSATRIIQYTEPCVKGAYTGRLLYRLVMADANLQINKSLPFLSLTISTGIRLERLY